MGIIFIPRFSVIASSDQFFQFDYSQT